MLFKGVGTGNDEPAERIISDLRAYRSNIDKLCVVGELHAIVNNSSQVGQRYLQTLLWE